MSGKKTGFPELKNVRKIIVIKRNEAYILKKNGISQGTAEDIRNIVSREMGNRFVNRVKG